MYPKALSLELWICLEENAPIPTLVMHPQPAVEITGEVGVVIGNFKIIDRKGMFSGFVSLPIQVGYCERGARTGNYLFGGG